MNECKCDADDEATGGDINDMRPLNSKARTTVGTRFFLYSLNPALRAPTLY